MKMSFGLLSSFVLLLSANVVLPAEALLFSPPSAAVATNNRHRGMLSVCGRSSSTALFFKNSTTNHYDIDQNPNPLTKQSGDGAITSTIPTARSLPEDDFAPFDDNCFPGRDENDRFLCDPSVAFWRNFQNQEPHEPLSAEENFRDMNVIARRFLSGTQRSSTYFGKHIGRTTYFIMNALLGDAAYQFSKRVGANNDADRKGSDDQGPLETKKGSLPMGMSLEHASRLLLESLLCYEEDYFNYVAKGIYREPWDMATSNHRQSNPIRAMTQTGRFVREAVGTLGRRSRRDKDVRFFRNNNSNHSRQKSPAPKAAKKAHGTKLYPDYYQTAFHYQGDGWMSTDSANVYETSTETLFLGRQDSMQRSSLPPLLELAEKFGSPKTPQQETKTRPMRVLEVACGTGRFLTFARDSLPLDAEYTAVDLSPFYLEKASDNDDYWRNTRETQEGSSSSSIAPATLVQAKAEALPFGDDSFDAVLCMYLFHELPRHVRAKAAAEMARVVAPGGTVVFTDSIQKGDRPTLDHALPNFQKMNEPFYVDFVNDDLGSHFEEAGLIPQTKSVRSTTKSLSFTKPGELSL